MAEQKRLNTRFLRDVGLRPNPRSRLSGLTTMAITSPASDGRRDWNCATGQTEKKGGVMTERQSVGEEMLKAALD
jgi:hypothetical protein